MFPLMSSIGDLTACLHWKVILVKETHGAAVWAPGNSSALADTQGMLGLICFPPCQLRAHLDKFSHVLRRKQFLRKICANQLLKKLVRTEEIIKRVTNKKEILILPCFCSWGRVKRKPHCLLLKATSLSGPGSTGLSPRKDMGRSQVSTVWEAAAAPGASPRRGLWARAGHPPLGDDSFL